jgi:hypothetical protein
MYIEFILYLSFLTKNHACGKQNTVPSKYTALLRNIKYSHNILRLVNVHHTLTWGTLLVHWHLLRTHLQITVTDTRADTAAFKFCYSLHCCPHSFGQTWPEPSASSFYRYFKANYRHVNKLNEVPNESMADPAMFARNLKHLHTDRNESRKPKLYIYILYTKWPLRDMITVGLTAMIIM